MSDWTSIEFPWDAMNGDYARLEDHRYIVMEERRHFETYEELKDYIENKIRAEFTWREEYMRPYQLYIGDGQLGVDAETESKLQYDEYKHAYVDKDGNLIRPYFEVIP